MLSYHLSEFPHPLFPKEATYVTEETLRLYFILVYIIIIIFLCLFYFIVCIIWLYLRYYDEKG